PSRTLIVSPSCFLLTPTRNRTYNGLQAPPEKEKKDGSDEQHFYRRRSPALCGFFSSLSQRGPEGPLSWLRRLVGVRRRIFSPNLSPPGRTGVAPENRCPLDTGRGTDPN